MKNRLKNRVYYGTIEGYSYGQWVMILYLSFHNKRVPYKIPILSVYRKLHKLTVYRKDGSLDFGKLEGMRISVKAVQWMDRVFIKEIMLDLSYYDLSEE